MIRFSRYVTIGHVITLRRVSRTCPGELCVSVLSGRSCRVSVLRLLKLEVGKRGRSGICSASTETVSQNTSRIYI
jgi:hypothetical protein